MTDHDVPETVPTADEAAWEDARIGRYVFRRLVGTGGMGVVIAAHDPELDREVAIKLVASSVFDGDRGIREAQAMARLSHPNVVRVYEVLRLEMRTAIVMELVDGEELAAWQRKDDRSWHEILDAYIAAGRGLAAAHRAGIVHRDFKPSNVLIDREGIVRVGDFGLAQRASSETLDGAGTPGYMAPEQHRKAVIDTRTDQWSFACALYEALYRRRPFASAEERQRLSDAVIEGLLEPEPARSPVPRRIRAAIRRALSPTPDDRFATMDDLLAVLAARPRRTPLWLGGGATVAVILAVFVMTRRSEAALCGGLDAPMSAVWTATARSDVRARLLAPGVDLPEPTISNVLRDLDDYAARWTRLRTRACTESHQGVSSSVALDARTRCLDQRLSAMSGLLDGLAVSEPATLRAARDAVAQLPPVEECASAHEPRKASPAEQAEVDVAEDSIARATVLISLNKYQDALPLAERAIAAGTNANELSLVARALVIRGEGEEQSGQMATSLASYRLAAETAAKARDHRVVADALARAFFIEGDRLGRRDDALRSRRFIELAVESAGSPDDIRAEWLHLLAVLLYVDPSQREEAARHIREALAIRQRILPASHVHIVDTMETLANIEAQLKNYDEAERLLQQVLAARIASRGPSDRSTGFAYNNLGIVEYSRGHLAAAVVYWSSAVEIGRRAGVPSLPAIFNRGLAEFDMGRWRDAAASFSEAMEVYEKQTSESLRNAGAATYLGATWIALGDVERGRAMLMLGTESARRAKATVLPTALAFAARLAIHERELADARALIDELLTLPSNSPELKALVLAEMARAEATNAKTGCAAAKPRLLEALGEDGGVAFPRTIANVALAECMVLEGDIAGAKKRLDDELALLTEAGADEVAKAGTIAARAKLR